MDAAFQRALHCRPPTIAGVALRPFSAYHAQTLLVLDNPLMVGGGEITPVNLTMALYVCADDSVTGPARLFPAPDQERVAAIAEAMDFEADSARFAVYAGEYLTLPDVETPLGPDGNPDVRCSGMPWPWAVVTSVLAGFPSIRRHEAWNMPLCELCCYRAALLERAGCDIVTDRMREAYALAEKANAAIVAAAQAKGEAVNG